ncbi:MAG: VanZ family protein [Candidatus Omnitrophica bacterium]|nr:VanZ family protein [Candidatus Omnitrophota bacterium]
MSERIKRWLIVTIYVLFVYSTLYFVRPVCEFLKENTPFEQIVNVILYASLFAVVLLIKKFFGLKSISTYIFLGLTTMIYLAGFALVDIPEEKIHFAEYGVLSILVFWALRYYSKHWHRYLAAFIMTSLIGLGDEVIQHFLPNRYYQISDVILNAISGGLGLAWVYIVNYDKRLIHEKFN